MKALENRVLKASSACRWVSLWGTHHYLEREGEGLSKWRKASFKFYWPSSLWSTFFVILVPSYPVPLTIFTLGPRSPSSQTLPMLAREKSFVKSVVSGQLHFEASSKFSSKSRLSWTLYTCAPVFSYLLFFLKRKLKRPERISKRSNNEEFYVLKVKFIPLGYAWSSYLFQREFFFFPRYHGQNDSG